MKNEIYLRFSIWDFEDITHDEITMQTGIKPTKILIKGEKINPKFNTVAKENGWILGSEKEKYGSFEEQLEMLYNIISLQIEIFAFLSRKYFCELSCAVYIYVGNEESTPSIHLNSKYHELSGKINMDFDVDIYCLPNK